MNLYIILEGEQTETIVYPAWIKHILPNYTKVDFEYSAKENNFYIFSGGGIPSIYNHVVNAIKNINDNPIYNKLIVCLDGEEIGYDARIAKVNKTIDESGIKLTDDCQLHIIVQDACIETWFLGNRKIFKRNPQSLLLREYINHYNVLTLDPENMGNYTHKNKARFHIEYLREIFKEQNLIYKKNRPEEVTNEKYLNELISRNKETNHLVSFSIFIELLFQIKDFKNFN
ncbi:MAG: hypothetical protein V4581_02055 [Bacteroidota bacterium]